MSILPSHGSFADCPVREQRGSFEHLLVTYIYNLRKYVTDSECQPFRLRITYSLCLEKNLSNHCFVEYKLLKSASVELYTHHSTLELDGLESRPILNLIHVLNLQTSFPGTRGFLSLFVLENTAALPVWKDVSSLII